MIKLFKRKFYHHVKKHVSNFLKSLFYSKKLLLIFFQIICLLGKSHYQTEYLLN